MPRMSGKARKIAYAILGKPANLKKKPRKTKVEQRIDFEESSRVRVKDA